MNMLRPPLLAALVLLAGQPPAATAQQPGAEWKADCLCAVAGTDKVMGVFNVTAANVAALRALLQGGSGEVGTRVVLVGRKCPLPAQCGRSYTDPRYPHNNAAIDGPRAIKVTSATGLPRERAGLKPEKLAAGDQIVLIGDPVQ